MRDPVGALPLMRFPGPALEDRVPDTRTVLLYREGRAQACVVEALCKPGQPVLRKNRKGHPFVSHFQGNLSR
jgi:hypothetical protein